MSEASKEYHCGCHKIPDAERSIDWGASVTTPVSLNEARLEFGAWMDAMLALAEERGVDAQEVFDAIWPPTLHNYRISPRDPKRLAELLGEEDE